MEIGKNADILEKAVINLIQSKQGPFYASLILMMKRIPTKMKRGAMGVGVRNGQVCLYYDLEWLNKMTVQQVMFALEHECLHLILSHLDRMGDRDLILSNIAADFCVNGLILENPGPCVEPYDICVAGKGPYEHLPKGEHFEWYYSQLYNNADHYEVTMNGDGTITVKNKKTGKEQTFNPNSHEDWESMEKGDSSLNKEIIKQMIKKAYMEAKDRGTLPGKSISDLIEELLEKSVVDWKALLRRYCAASILSYEKESSWKRVNRRFGVDFPGYVKIRQPKIAVALDTSGSMSDEELLDCAKELRAIQKIYNATVTIYECDAAVQKVYDLSKFSKIDTSFAGRGGTAFTPVFEALEGKQVDLLIYFTDLAGDNPPKPKFKVIWVTPSQMDGQKFSEMPGGFGRHVQITKKQK